MILDPFLSNFRWYRRLRGGHWERWHIEQVWAQVWLQRVEHGVRPPLGHGTPICEDYDPKVVPDLRSLYRVSAKTIDEIGTASASKR